MAAGHPALGAQELRATTVGLRWFLAASSNYLKIGIVSGPLPWNSLPKSCVSYVGMGAVLKALVLKIGMPH